jgi:antitoxin component of MazEF toxin-antitoxin module
MARAIIERWGNSLAVRIPGDLVKSFPLSEGCTVDIERQGAALVVTPCSPPLSAADLFSGKSAAAWRAEYESACNWGDDIGREIVSE